MNVIKVHAKASYDCLYKKRGTGERKAFREFANKTTSSLFCSMLDPCLISKLLACTVMVILQTYATLSVKDNIYKLKPKEFSV